MKIITCFWSEHVTGILVILFSTIFVTPVFSQSTKNFPACSVEITFSGNPSPISPEKFASASAMFGTIDTAWEYWSIEFGKAVGEVGICFCPKEPSLTQLRNENNKASKWNKTITGIGTATTSPVLDAPVIDCKNCNITRSVNPFKSANCFLHQQAFSQDGNSAVTKLADKFFSSIRNSQFEEQRSASQVQNAELEEVKKSQALERERIANQLKTTQLEEERVRLAKEREKLDAEKAQIQQAKTASRLSIRRSATEPDAYGDFTITIQTGADTASLTIDGEELGGKRDGNYVIKRVARVGEQNTYTITARDVFGNTDSKTISVARQAVNSRPTFAGLNPANIKPRPFRDAVAIIIGIQNYKLMPKAEYANQDAQDFYNYATRALGIQQANIKLLVDDEADVSGIYKAFQNWLPLKVRKGKTDVYVFYSGHGLPSADGKSLYFLPVGADRDLIGKTGISQREIVDALKAAQPKSVTMFIDSCYSGQIRTGETLLASARPVELTVQETAYPPDFTVISASASDQIASSSPDLKHGIFSYYLMKGLEGEADDNKDGTITIGKLQSYLAEQVPRHAMTIGRKQEPQLTGDASRVLVWR